MRCLHLYDPIIDEFKAYKVDKLGFSCGHNDPGYIILSRGRSGNVELHKWYTNNIIIPYVKEQRRINGLADDSLACYQLDGETKQIQCFSEYDVLLSLENNHICVGKLPASTTHINQPCDVGDCFRASKGKLRGIKDVDVKSNLVLVNKIKDILTDANATFAKGKQMTSAHVKMASWGCVRIQRALQETITPTIILDSYKKSGLYDHDITPPGCNIPTMLGNLKSYNGDRLTAADETAVLNALPNLQKQLRTQGELLEKDFDDNGIRSNITGPGAVKDDLVLTRRRYVFLTNPALIANEAAKRLAKAVKKAKVVPRSKKIGTVVAPTVVTSASVQPSITVHNPTANGWYCANPVCGAVYNEAEKGNTWLGCDCCDPSLWVCGICHEWMQTHERQCKL